MQTCLYRFRGGFGDGREDENLLHNIENGSFSLNSLLKPQAYIICIALESCLTLIESLYTFKFGNQTLIITIKVGYSSNQLYPGGTWKT